MAGESTGAAIREGSPYRSAIVPLLALALAPPALGIAEGAFDDFIKRLPGKTVAYTQNEVQMDMPMPHMRVGQTKLKIDTARMPRPGVQPATSKTPCRATRPDESAPDPCGR